ncbi:hypothetical protein CG709_09905, partial [Lachnotalea glycerini]
MRMNNNQNNDNNNNPKNRQTILYFLIIALVTLLIMNFFTSIKQESTMKKITYDQFMTMLDNKEVKSVYVDSDKIIITPKEQASRLITIEYYTGIFSDPDLQSKLEAAGASYDAKIPDSRSTILDILFVYVLPIAMVWLMASFILKRMSKGGGMMGVGKSNTKIYVEKQTGGTAKDGAGQNEAKETLQEVGEPQHLPPKHTRRPP